MATFQYTFEELPLVIAPGIDAALINGRAEIEYSRDGSWTISSIEVEGYRKLTLAQRTAGEKSWVYLPASEAIVGIISGRLEREWSEKIDDAVAEQIDADSEAAADDYADMKREERMMERV